MTGVRTIFIFDPMLILMQFFLSTLWKEGLGALPAHRCSGNGSYGKMNFILITAPRSASQPSAPSTTPMALHRCPELPSTPLRRCWLFLFAELFCFRDTKHQGTMIEMVVNDWAAKENRARRWGPLTFGHLLLHGGHERDLLIYFLTQRRACFQIGVATPGGSPWREESKTLVSNDLPSHLTRGRAPRSSNAGTQRCRRGGERPRTEGRGWGWWAWSPWPWDKHSGSATRSVNLAFSITGNFDWPWPWRDSVTRILLALSQRNEDIWFSKHNCAPHILRKRRSWECVMDPREVRAGMRWLHLTDYLRSSGPHLLHQILPASSAAWAPSSVLAMTPLWASWGWSHAEPSLWFFPTLPDSDTTSQQRAERLASQSTRKGAQTMPLRNVLD